MKLLKPFLAGLICALAILASPQAACAAPANPKHISADAKWFIHLDAQAARQTGIYKQVLDAVRIQFPLEATMEQLKMFIGINPLTDITGVTVYNDSFEKDVAGLIIYANYDKNLLINAIGNNPNYKEQDHGAHKLSTWTDANDGKAKAGCFYDDGTLVMADGIDSVKLVVDVLDGKKPAGSPLVKAPDAGVFLYGAADIAHAGDANLSKLLSNSAAVTAQVDETNGNVRVTVALTSKTADMAGLLGKMAEGLKALGQLATQDMPTLAGLIRQVQVNVDDAKVTASFQHDIKTIFQTFQMLDAENKARIAKK